MAGNIKSNTYKPKTKKGWIQFTVCFILAVLVVGLLGYSLTHKNGRFGDYVIEVGNKGITKKEYNHIIDLADKYGVSENDARSQLVNYYKDKILADKFNINLDDVFIQNGKKASAAQLLGNNENSIVAYMDDDNDYTDMMAYSYSFDSRVEQSLSGGYGIVMYDFPYVPINFLFNGKPGPKSEQTMKTKSSKMRENLVSGKVSDLDALKKIKNDKYLSSISLTGATFISTGGENINSISAPSLTEGVLSGKELLPKLEKMKPGVSKIYHIKHKSYYFIDYKYKVKKDNNFPAKVNYEKGNIRVVEYDRD